jgi:hypothetical protein
MTKCRNTRKGGNRKRRGGNGVLAQFQKALTPYLLYQGAKYYHKKKKKKGGKRRTKRRKTKRGGTKRRRGGRK